MTFTLPPWRGKRKPRDPNPKKLPPDEDAKRRQLPLPVPSRAAGRKSPGKTES